MLDRFISITLLYCLLAAIPATAAPPDDRAAAAPAPDLKPVTVAVVDQETGEPVTAFTYKFRYRSPGCISPYMKTWQPVESPSGTVAVRAPTACCLGVEVRSKDFKAGWRNDREFIIRSNDEARRVVMKMERGATVHGIVRDATTREPIAGATVTPAPRLPR